MERVSALEKIQALYVASLCNILPETIKIIFEHCKARYRLCQYVSTKKDNDVSLKLFLRMNPYQICRVSQKNVLTLYRHQNIIR